MTSNADRSERLVGRRFGLFVVEADRGVFSAFLACVLASVVTASCEVRLLQEGPVPRVLQVEGQRSRDGLECRVVLLDITERKQAEEVLKQRAVELERFHRLSVGRELRMIELKQEVNELAGLLGRTLPYDLSKLTLKP